MTIFVRRRTTLAMLEAFDAVAHTGSIGAAAKTLGISQPTLSTSLSRLEALIGVPLLERTISGTIPTPAGERLVGAVREVLEASDIFEDLVDEIVSPVAVAQDLVPNSGKASGVVPVKVAASFTIAEHLLPKWLAQAPLQSDLEVCNSTRVQELINSGKAELGLVESPKLLGGIRARTICHDELVVVAGPGHQLVASAVKETVKRGVTTSGKAVLGAAGEELQLTVAQFLAQDLVTRETGSGTRIVLERALRSHGFEVPPAARSLGSTQALKATVALGSALGAISRLAVEKELRSGELVPIRVCGLDLQRRLYLVHGGGFTLRTEARVLALHLIKAAQR